jgi:hypothetical protein
MFPLPFGAPQDAPPAAVHVQVALAIAGGKTSVTVAPAAVFGPAFETTIV